MLHHLFVPLDRCVLATTDFFILAVCFLLFCFDIFCLGLSVGKRKMLPRQDIVFKYCAFAYMESVRWLRVYFAEIVLHITNLAE